MSASARRRIGIAMRKRWAERKRATKLAPKPAAKKAQRGGMSAAARKQQSARMKAYWAAKRKQAKTA
jgi:hypothetical protein